MTIYSSQFVAGRYLARALIIWIITSLPGWAQLSYTCGNQVSPPFDIGKAEVGQQSRCTFAIVNGTTPQTVSSIDYPDGIIYVPTPERPALPRQLGPRESLTFSIVFSPVDPGVGANFITIHKDSLTNNDSINLTGTGLVPRTDVNITPTGVLTPGTQVRVQLSLAGSGYPGIDLYGKMMLPLDSAPDRAVMFETGNTVTFKIPQDKTQAVFDIPSKPGATDVGFQTGTVAGNIMIQAQFFTGGLDQTEVTSMPAPASMSLIQRAPPVVKSAVIEQSGAANFTLRTTAFSTSREMTGVTVHLNPAAGANVSPAAYEVPDVKATFDQYYQTPRAQAAGSQFVLSLPGSFIGDRSALRSISITMSNQQGPSNTVEAEFQ